MAYVTKKSQQYSELHMQKSEILSKENNRNGIRQLSMLNIRLQHFSLWFPSEEGPNQTRNDKPPQCTFCDEWLQQYQQSVRHHSWLQHIGLVQCSPLQITQRSTHSIGGISHLGSLPIIYPDPDPQPEIRRCISLTAQTDRIMKRWYFV